MYQVRHQVLSKNWVKKIFSFLLLLSAFVLFGQQKDFSVPHQSELCFFPINLTSFSPINASHYSSSFSIAIAIKQGQKRKGWRLNAVRRLK
jgi:hypothetical protein